MVTRIHKFLSENHYQSIFWSFVYFVHPVIIYIIKRDTIILSLIVVSGITSFFCYYICLFCIKLGKRVTGSQYVGGHIGGLVGAILFALALYALFFLWVVLRME